MSRGRHDLVAMGASWGGLEAIRAVLAVLPGDLDAAIVVAQHRAVDSMRNGLRDLLGAATRLRVVEAGDKDALEPGTVYVAAPDYHLLVDENGLALSTDEPVLYARPSIDVLLQSAAESHRERCVGVVLTGANDDGSRGLARVQELGGVAIVQDPTTAVRAEMPRAALAAVPDATVAAPSAIGELLTELCGVQVPA